MPLARMADHALSAGASGNEGWPGCACVGKVLDTSLAHVSRAVYSEPRDIWRLNDTVVWTIVFETFDALEEPRDKDFGNYIPYI